MDCDLQVGGNDTPAVFVTAGVKEKVSGDVRRLTLCELNRREQALDDSLPQEIHGFG